MGKCDPYPGLPSCAGFVPVESHQAWDIASQYTDPRDEGRGGSTILIYAFVDS